MPTLLTGILSIVTSVAASVSSPPGGAEAYDAGASPRGDRDYVSWVDPRIESARGRWFFSTPAARPFGMVKLTPHTVNRGQGGGGYNSTVQTALGFCHLHGWMTTGLEVMPTSGGDFSVTEGEAGWKSAFDPATEIVEPGFHKLFLERYATWVELTTTRRVGLHRYTFTRDGRADIVINLGGPAGPMKMRHGRITRVSDTELEGHYDRTDGMWGGPSAVRIFFVIRFERAFSRYTTYRDEAHDSISAYVTYDGVASGDELRMKAALSFTSIPNARANLAAELDHWDFDAVKEESQRVWNAWLGRIDVEGGTEAQRKKFYTDLWHVLLGRHVLSDVGGTYPDYTNGRGGNGPLRVRQLPLRSDGRPRFHMYNSDAYWLTQWNINLVWGLAWPRVLDEFCRASLQMARDGGKLPRGPCGGGYTHIMTACPATMMIVGAYMKGCASFDPEEAFAIIRDNHSVGGSNMLGADAFYVERGWKAGSAGWTVEMCFQDWCAAQMARKLGKTGDYRELLRRSTGWTHLFHAPTGLLLPRGADGRFSHTDPLSGRGWVEANAWQASWFTSHDVQGLVNLMGGPDEYCRKLNFAFEKEVEHDFVHGYGAGYVSYANQPGCQNAHLFTYAGKPWLTQYWVRRVNEQAYGGTSPQLGYGGHDEDQGQMGGVSALMSMGLFSVRGTCAVDPIYEITSPVFDRITIALDDKYYPGRRFVISTTGNSAANMYIQSARLDGRPLTRAWFHHRELVDGGTLELVLGPEPNREWGASELPPSESPPALPIDVLPRRATLRLPAGSVRLRARVEASEASAASGDPSVRWRSTGGDGRVELSRPGELETWASFDRPGVHTLEVTATSGGRTGRRSVVVEVLELSATGGPSFDEWIARFGSLPAERRGPDQDPDGDGLSNLLERFFAGDPTRPDVEVSPRRVGERGARRLLIRQGRRLPPGSSCVLEQRATPGPGGWRLVPGISVRESRERPDGVLLEIALPEEPGGAEPGDLRLRVREQPVNLAPRAKVSASSAFHRSYGPHLAVDGVQGVHMSGEWSSAGEATPWIGLEWPGPVTIRSVRLFDRPNLDDHTEAGTLTFSDGSRVEVGGLRDDGRAREVGFEPKTVTWIRFDVTRGRGRNRGLSEIEVLSGEAIEASFTRW